MISLKGKKILITGATSGIGRETAILLNSLGADLVLIGRDEERLKELSEIMTDQITICYDLSNIDSVMDVMKKIAKEYGILNGVVHAAGVHEMTPLRTVSVQKTREILNINVETAIQLLRACGNKKIMADGGSVVLLSSASGLVGEAGVISYSASKGAIVSIAKSSAMELANRGIRVNTLAPGIVETPMSQSIQQKVGESHWEEIAKLHPLGIGKPVDIAQPIAFLLSEASKWITGVTIPVDGGYTAH